MLTRWLPCLALAGLGCFAAITPVGAQAPLTLTSPAFQDGQPIPDRYARTGGNVSPELHIQNVPPGAVQIVLTCDDPDAPAGDWTHWILTDIPPATAVIPEGNPSGIGTAGKNSFGQSRYDGPQPPSGTHRYIFNVYAIKSRLSLGSSVTLPRVLSAMRGLVLAKATLMGTYSAR